MLHDCMTSHIRTFCAECTLEEKTGEINNKYACKREVCDLALLNDDISVLSVFVAAYGTAKSNPTMLH